MLFFSHIELFEALKISLRYFCNCEVPVYVYHRSFTAGKALAALTGHLYGGISPLILLSFSQN
jgi:hypothetical protein